MVGQGKLMKQQSVYFILKQLSNNNFEYKKFNFLVEKVFKIAHMYIFHNMTRIPSSTTDGHSNKDHAIEAISELFIKNKNNSYPICNSFNNWRPSISNEDETLFFLYKVTSSRVEQYITKSLKEADPISAKILDALNYVIKKSSYKKKHILGKKFICNSENKDLELQIISADDLQLIPSHYFQNTNKIFENLFNYFGENSESYTAIPINALAARIKQIHSSFPYFRLDLYPTDWISFNYFHAWLESDVIDSTIIYPSYRDGINRIQYRSKYLASHTLTFRPISGLSFSLGESVVYSDKLEFLYLFPLSFFRAADHYYSNQNNNAGANSQFFFSLSSRNHIPNTHLFATLLIDEIALSDIGDPERERSQIGFVFGGSVTDLPIDNLTFALNYTRINPFVYEHYIPTQTYESRSYVMGHWMQHNADQIYLSLNYRIIRGLQVKVWTESIRKGGEGVVDDQYTRPSKPFLFGFRSNYTNWGFNAKYEIIHEAFVSLDFKSFLTSEEQDGGAFIDIRHNEFFMSLNYGF